MDGGSGRYQAEEREGAITEVYFRITPALEYKNKTSFQATEFVKSSELPVTNRKELKLGSLFLGDVN